MNYDTDLINYDLKCSMEPLGVTLFMEGLHKHVPKAYINLPMGFALFVELLQMRYGRNINRR